MVDESAHELDRVFHALADPTRRRIIGALANGPSTIGELSRPFPISLAAVSKHVKVLERARLVRRRVRGREHQCSLDPAGLDDARDWLRYHQRFWEQSLDALEEHLATHDAGANVPATDHPGEETKSG